MTFLKQNWFKLTLIFIALIVIVLWLIVPMHYKRYCAQKAYATDFSKLGLNLIDRESVYKICLEKYGI